MNIKFIAPLALIVFIVCLSAFGQQISHEELVEILGIKSWRVPSPKNQNRAWGISIVDAVPRKYNESFNADQYNSEQKALIVLRDMGNSVYRFTLKQRDGTSQGDLKVDLCAGHSKDEVCDTSYVIDFFDTPKPFDNGTKFVIGEIHQMVQEKYKKQIVIELRQIRLE